MKKNNTKKTKYVDKTNNFFENSPLIILYFVFGLIGTALWCIIRGSAEAVAGAVRSKCKRK